MSTGFLDFMFKPIGYKAEIEKYIINENATIIFWDDNTKTISKRHKEDKFDKELKIQIELFPL